LHNHFLIILITYPHVIIQIQQLYVIHFIMLYIELMDQLFTFFSFLKLI